MEKLYLRKLDKLEVPAAPEYPFTTPVVQALGSFAFEKPVTIFCGENGCGKSTLLEILACKLGATRIGWLFDRNRKRKSVELHADCFRTTTFLRPSKCFFFTAEDFIKYIEWVESEKYESLEAIEEVDARNLTTYAAGLAKMPHARTLYELDHLYQRNLAGQSHGEGFLEFFRSRIHENGLFLLDEPEGALSYENQYLLSRIVMDYAAAGCQFVLATHSPVITAIPGADLVDIRAGELVRCAYDEISNNSFLRMFLSRREQMMKD